MGDKIQSVRHGLGSAWSAVSWGLVFVATVGVLLAAAAYNRFPLLFPDTGAYLSVAYDQRWTIDRSGFYGLIFKPLLLASDTALGLWLAVTAQASVVGGIMILVTRKFLSADSSMPACLVIVATAALTSLPWHVGQLMPDAVTGSLILLAWFAASRAISEPGSPLLWLLAAMLALTHFTHLGLLAVAAAVALTFAAMTGTPAREIGRRALALALAISAVVSAHVTANGLLFQRWTISPMGPWFLFARVHEDGLAQPWLDRHCGSDAPQPLCDIRASLPQDSQVLLWSKSSPLHPHIHQRTGSPEFWRWIDMLDLAASGSIREQPLAFAASAAKGTAKQLIHFQTLDDECPVRCASADLIRLRPALAEQIRGSRQLRDQLPRDEIRALHTVVAIVSLLSFLPLIRTARRRNDKSAQSLLVTIAVCLVVNAVMAGALSDVHDRYQSRVIWLAPFAVLLLMARWRPSPVDKRDYSNNQANQM